MNSNRDLLRVATLFRDWFMGFVGPALYARLLAESSYVRDFDAVVDARSSA